MTSDPTPQGEPPTTGELPIPELLDETQVAQILTTALQRPVPVSRVRALRRAGQLRFVPTSPGRRRHFRSTPGDVRAYLDELMQPRTPHAGRHDERAARRRTA